jgi:hypothetical protein
VTARDAGFALAGFPRNEIDDGFGQLLERGDAPLNTPFQFTHVLEVARVQIACPETRIRIFVNSAVALRDGQRVRRGGERPPRVE